MNGFEVVLLMSAQGWTLMSGGRSAAVTFPAAAQHPH
jgi:hypothetical protein